MLCVYSRAVVRGGAGGVLAPSEFRSSVDPIPTREGRLCPPHNNASPAGLDILHVQIKEGK